MSLDAPVITGVGSVSPFGVVKGPIPLSGRPATGAHRVAPFRAADVVPGLKTRRLDRLSVWSLVASALALQDAGVQLDAIDGSRVAVVFGTGFGCLELSEAFFKSMVDNGYEGADPIVFPETLGSSPASHVSRQFGFRGPAITLSCGGVSAEAALFEAASLLRNREADMAIVIAGDELTRALDEWLQLAPGRPVAGEGLAAAVMEARGRSARPYVRVVSGRMAAEATTVIPPLPCGEFEAGGLLRLVLALSGEPRLACGDLALLAASSASGNHAAVLLEAA